MNAKITIRRAVVLARREPVYRWHCPECGVGGTHHFNRFTDRIRKRPPVHPWRRCIDAVDQHICTAHRGMLTLGERNGS